MKDFANRTVGEIVTQNIEYAKIFQSFGIDFCCGGDMLLSAAAKKALVPLETVIEQLEGSVNSQSVFQALNFDAWSLELLIDYIVKFHHNYIRTNGPEILSLLNTVVNAHGETDEHLREVKDLFQTSLIDLENHLRKEENILFPLIGEMLKASNRDGILPAFHCGSVQNPIQVMNREHDDEGARFRKILELTNSYQPPLHACNSYKLVLQELKQFEENLHIHIHVENNILFPKSIRLEESFM